MKKFTVYSELKFSIVSDSEESAIKTVDKYVSNLVNEETIGAYEDSNSHLPELSEFFLTETMFTTHSSFQTHSESCDELVNKIKSLLNSLQCQAKGIINSQNCELCLYCRLQDLVGD